MLLAAGLFCAISIRRSTRFLRSPSSTSSSTFRRKSKLRCRHSEFDAQGPTAPHGEMRKLGLANLGTGSLRSVLSPVHIYRPRHTWAEGHGPVVGSAKGNWGNLYLSATLGGRRLSCLIYSCRIIKHSCALKLSMDRTRSSSPAIPQRHAAFRP